MVFINFGVSRKFAAVVQCQSLLAARNYAKKSIYSLSNFILTLRLCSATKCKSTGTIHQSNKVCILSIDSISFPVANPRPPPTHDRRTF